VISVALGLGLGAGVEVSVGVWVAEVPVGVGVLGCAITTGAQDTMMHDAIKRRKLKRRLYKYFTRLFRIKQVYYTSFDRFDSS